MLCLYGLNLVFVESCSWKEISSVKLDLEDIDLQRRPDVEVVEDARRRHLPQNVDSDDRRRDNQNDDSDDSLHRYLVNSSSCGTKH